MDDIERKLKAFTAGVLKEAQEEAADIIQNVEDARREALMKAEADIRRETARYIREKKRAIKKKERNRVLSRTLSNRHRLLDLREQYADTIFNLVREKIRRFVETEPYVTHLQKLLVQAAEHIGHGASITVFLRTEDMSFANALTGAAPGLILDFKAGSFTLGGLIIDCPEKHLRIDMSFDTALTDNLGHFAELANLDLAR